MSWMSKASWYKTAQREDCGNLEHVYPIHGIKFTVFPKICYMLALDLTALYNLVTSKIPPAPNSAICWLSCSGYPSPPPPPPMPQLHPSLPWSYQVPLIFRARSACLQCTEQTRTTGLCLQTILFQSHTPPKVRLQLTRLLLLHKQCLLDWSGAIILLHSLLSVLLEGLQDLTLSDTVTLPQPAVVTMTFPGPLLPSTTSPGRHVSKISNF